MRITYSTEIGFCTILVYRVGRIAFWTSDALALRQSQSHLIIAIWIYRDTYYAIFAVAFHAVGHPFYLVDEKVIVISTAALGILIHVFYSLDVFGVFMLIEIQQWKEDFKWHDIFTPFISFTLHLFNTYLLSVFQATLYRKGYLWFDAFNAGLMATCCTQLKTWFLLFIADGAFGIPDNIQLRVPHSVVFHCFIQLWVNWINFIFFFIP